MFFGFTTLCDLRGICNFDNSTTRTETKCKNLIWITPGGCRSHKKECEDGLLCGFSHINQNSFEIGL